MAGPRNQPRNQSSVQTFSVQTIGVLGEILEGSWSVPWGSPGALGILLGCPGGSLGDARWVPGGSQRFLGVSGRSPGVSMAPWGSVLVCSEFTIELEPSSSARGVVWGGGGTPRTTGSSQAKLAGFVNLFATRHFAIRFGFSSAFASFHSTSSSLLRVALALLRFSLQFEFRIDPNRN